MKKLTLTLLAVLVASSGLFAGVKIKPVEGDAKVLKGEKEINVLFTYEGLSIGKEPSEQSYLTSRAADKNKRNPGAGDRWVKSWERDKEEIYPEKFLTLFNKVALKTHGIVAVQNSKSAKYTMKVNATWIEPGFFIPQVMKKPALVTMDISIFETSNPKNVVYKANIIKAPGSTFYDNDDRPSERIGESYAISGKYFSNFLFKKYLKK